MLFVDFSVCGCQQGLILCLVIPEPRPAGLSNRPLRRNYEIGKKNTAVSVFAILFHINESLSPMLFPSHKVVGPERIGAVHQNERYQAPAQRVEWQLENCTGYKNVVRSGTKGNVAHVIWNMRDSAYSEGQNDGHQP